MRRITKKQIIAIRTMASKKFSDEEYHDWLWWNFKKESTKDLSYSEAESARKLLYKPFNHTPFDRVRSYTAISKAQAERIAILEVILEWHEDQSRLAGFVKKQTGKDVDVMKLSKKEAQKVITGMQRIVAPESDDYKKLNNTKNSNLYDCYIDIKCS